MPARKKGPRKKAHHHHAGWLHNYEDELPLAEGLEIISKIVSALSERGEVRIDKAHVKPPPQAYFIIRYERAPHGELKLKLEIEWEPDVEYLEPADGPPEIE